MERLEQRVEPAQAQAEAEAEAADVTVAVLVGRVLVACSTRRVRYQSLGRVDRSQAARRTMTTRNATGEDASRESVGE